MTKNKGCRRNPDGMMDALKDMWKEMFTLEFLKESGIVGVSSVMTPVTSGIINGIGNRIKQGMIPDNWWIQKGVDLFATVVNAGVATLIFRKPEITRLVMLGGVGGTFSDAATEKMLPAFGLGAFVTAKDLEKIGMSGAAMVEDLPPELLAGRGVGDFATAEDVEDANVLGGFATIDDVEAAEDAGVGDFATVEDLNDTGDEGVGDFLTAESIEGAMGEEGF